MPQLCVTASVKTVSTSLTNLSHAPPLVQVSLPRPRPTACSVLPVSRALSPAWHSASCVWRKPRDLICTLSSLLRGDIPHCCPHASLRWPYCCCRPVPGRDREWEHSTVICSGRAWAQLPASPQGGGCTHSGYTDLQRSPTVVESHNWVHSGPPSMCSYLHPLAVMLPGFQHVLLLLYYGLMAFRGSEQE